MTQRKLRSWLVVWADVNGFAINAHVDRVDVRDRRRLADNDKQVDMITITDPKKAAKVLF